MHAIAALLCVSLLSSTSADDLPDGPEPSLEAIFRPPRLLGVRPTSVGISAEGGWVTWRWTDADAEQPSLAWWIQGAAEDEPRLLFPADVRVRLWWLPVSEELLVYQDGWLSLVAPDEGAPGRPLVEVGDGLADLTFLHDGSDRFLFRQGAEQDFWWVDPAAGERRLLGADLAGKSPWSQVLGEAGLVAVFARGDAPDQEPRRLHLLPLDGGPARAVPVQEGGRVEVSPDGRWVARTRQETDRSRQLIMANYLTETVTTVPVRNSLAGDEAAAVTVELTEVVTGRSFQPPIAGQERYHLLRASWAPHGGRLLLERVEQDWHLRELVVVDAQARTVRTLFTERDEGWIGGPMLTSRWIEDGAAVLFSSEQSGFNHLYRVPAGGGDVTPVTQGEHEIQELQELGRSGDRFLLRSNAPDPAVQRYEVLDLDGGARTPLTPAEGVASRAVISRDGAAVAWLQEFLGVPGEVYRRDLGTEGAGARRLSHTIPQALQDLELPPPEIVEYHNPEDGARVRALLYRPEPFDPDRRYPAVVFIHGAGYLQNVTRSMTEYAVNYLFHQRLARKGYVVLDADYRHSAGYGRDFRAAVRGFLGGKDLEDVAAAVPYLESLGFVDGDRVGTYGGSYGGFLTLMALFTKPEVFACGAALRSVTDWRSYHAWYTNPRLGDPEEEPENYVRSSPIDHAEGLQRPLLLLHGLQDSNVFAQDTIRLMEKLIQLGKDFDAMLYPSQNHGFTDPESWIDEYRRIERFFDRHLAAPREAPRRSF